MQELESILGKSKPIKELKEKLEQVLHLDVPILFVGENGVGKDFLVNLVSRLNKKKLIKLHSDNLETELNLIPKSLNQKLEFPKNEKIISESIYFDRIENLNFEAQAILFKLVEKKEYSLESKSKLIFEGRFFFSTSNSILDNLKNGSFRKDLFQKIQLVRINLPTLSERKEDIPFLVNFFLTEFSKKHKKKINSLSDKLIHFLKNYDFPESVSELETILESMVLFSKEKVLDIKHLPKDYLEYSNQFRKKIPVQAGIKLADYEKEIIIENLRFQNNNREKTAKLLGISERTLYRKIKEYKIN